MSEKYEVAILAGMTAQDTHTLKDLAPFYDIIFTDVKKDLRDDHLRSDKGFFKRNFAAKQLGKISVDELIAVYGKIIDAGYVEVSEFIANRWMLRHLDIYNFFEGRLKEVKEHFFEIESLEDTFAKRLRDDAVALFGATDTYIFAQLNSVQFSPSVMQELREMALLDYARATTSPT